MKTSISSDGTSKSKIRLASILFMGLGHIIYLKQYLKGMLFAAIEIIFLFFLPEIVDKIYGLITLGTPNPMVPVLERDNSIFMLIDGVIILAIVAVFLITYVISVKSALSTYHDYCISKELPRNKNFFSNMLGKAFPILGLAPSVILIMFFVVVPLVFSALVAFTNYSAPKNIPPNNTVDWVGFQNFFDMFGGSATWTSALGRVALWTLAWGALATFTCYIGGLIMAVVLHDSKIKIAPVFRAIFVLPYAVPSVVSMLIWQNMLNGRFGIVNRTLMSLGIIHHEIPWLSDPTFAKFTSILMNMWAGFPYFMLLITGTMTSISQDVFEAASIDGANKFQAFRRITLPLVLYQTVPLIIMSFTANINNFGAIFFLTGGNPVVSDTTTTSAGGTDIIVTWIYNLTINLMKYNYASVLAIMVFLVLAPFAIFNFRRTKSFKDGEI
ncbi:carbohydrate ABC transporter permease [Anaeromicropila herbilytica]|uniref:Maltose/maltodextrin transport system permease protein n=1 Tax=Anaeromicropila herbilytica TaxID=2785025 RepID=A0A7R7EKR1_9FIRM|nr:sugar ABC transporter permease [Anaeromicropila herbilytica]BCN30564.1 arabinogalactan ABC transporter permease [Anaeromicropila herbilytica]